jgi:SSS family solute:Na+ symporter
VIRAGQTASLLALVIAGAAAPAVEMLGGIFTYFQTGVTYLATPFVSVFILGILWKRTNYQGAHFGHIGGLANQTAIAWALRQGSGSTGCSGVPRPNHHHGRGRSGVAHAAGAGNRIITAMESASRHYDAGTARPFYKRVRLWLALYACIWVYLYWRFCNLAEQSG